MMSQREGLIAWSAVAEPADVAAGTLVDALGAAAALEWVRSAEHDLAREAMELAEHSGPELAEVAARGHERWQARLELADSPHEVRSLVVGARVITRGEAGWPRALDDLGPAAPFALYVRGDIDLDAAWSRSVAIVGSRSATSYGARVAGDLAAGAAGGGWAVLSGGAYGIDAAAHRAALAREGVTIAVMAGGVDRLYPVGNDVLLRSVIAQGAVVSEVPPGFAPHRSRFLSRNRLIGAANATVVVEAAHRSGALSTARHASQLLRPVGAVPGPVTSPSSSGCHGLVRDGVAVLVTDAHDLLELAAPATEWASYPHREAEPAGVEKAGPEFGTSDERALYDAAGKRRTPTGQLAASAGVGVGRALAALGALETRGLVLREEGQWRRAPAPDGIRRTPSSHRDKGQTRANDPRNPNHL